MSDHALTQVEDALATILAAYSPLSAFTVAVAESLDVAIEETNLPALLIATVAYSVDVFEEGNDNSIHSATIEVEAIHASQASGTISRANRNALAHVLAAVAADRSLGLGIQDIQEDDIAPVEPRGKDVDGASLRFKVQFFTSRSDWFTLL